MRINKKIKKLCNYDKTNGIGDSYYKDVRWALVDELRAQNKLKTADKIIKQIKKYWGKSE